MQKCPLCNKKIREDAKFCPQCGWDLTDHELTPLQIARMRMGLYVIYRLCRPFYRDCVRFLWRPV